MGAVKIALLLQMIVMSLRGPPTEALKVSEDSFGMDRVASQNSPCTEKRRRRNG